MILPLTADIRYLHQLAWRPAQFAHPLWLAAAGMNTASYHYGRNVVMDRALNTRLNCLRHFPQQPLPAVLSQQQQYQIVKPNRSAYPRAVWRWDWFIYSVMITCVCAVTGSNFRRY